MAGARRLFFGWEKWRVAKRVSCRQCFCSDILQARCRVRCLLLQACREKVHDNSMTFSVFSFFMYLRFLTNDEVI